ncbi:LIC11966 family lipoprotein [Leptospira kmetyi]|uniref:LIC11966 family lipoprotein n=1 Tax=Leptospira kmetyi TaxID=408139 RepID=UPI000593F58B|nr:ErpY-like lipoprotein [Leptospira kmetyi]
MKKQTTFTFLAAIVCILLLNTGCNSQDPISYNNKIMEIMNGSTDDMDALNDAMGKDDYVTAESIRKTWEEKLTKSAESLKSIGDFKGDSNLKNVSIKAVETYKNSVGSDYKQVIELRSGLKSGTKVDESKIDFLLNKINVDFEKAGYELNSASDKFEKDYNK